MKRTHRILLSLLSGFLLSLAWTQWMSGVIMFLAFIPLLLVEDYFYEHRERMKPYHFLPYPIMAFSLWNLISTWWIYNATFFGMIAAVLVSTSFMSFTFWLFHIARRKLGAGQGYFMLVFFWLGFEYLYLTGEVSWPWLTLGNAFAKDVQLIQWYEYTGALGGSLWILLLNFLLFLSLKQGIQLSNRRKTIQYLLFSVLFILVPIFLSLYIFHSWKEKGEAKEFVLLQPNIDPYYEKFNGMNPDDQVDTLLALAQKGASASTDFFVGPETALPYNIWEEQLTQSGQFKKIQSFLSAYPEACFVVGASTGKIFEPGETLTPTARKFRNANRYFDHYNTALQIHSDGSYYKYHKSKLVIGVEKMPFKKTLSFLETFALDLGGTMGSLGTQPDRAIFPEPGGQAKLAPVICYESVYGDYVCGYILNGANLICIITNDGWWGNSPGYRQHFSFARLRAIETRRAVARSANTGISGFINQRGEVLQQTGWWKRSVIKGNLHLNNDLSFYVTYGDYLGRISLLPALLGLLFMLSRSIMPRKT